MQHQSSAQTRREFIWKYFLDYCSTTSIHGIPYLTDRQRNWAERLFWFIALSISVWFCVSSIQDIWTKWRDNPVTMTMSEETLPISEIPLPTITICPDFFKSLSYRFNLDWAAYNWRYNRSIMSENQLDRLFLFKHICHLRLGSSEESYSGASDFVNTSIIDKIVDMAPTSNYVFGLCEGLFNYIGDGIENYICEDIFVPVITGEGVCFSINAFNSHDIYTEKMAPEIMTVTDRQNLTDWSLENGYNDIDNTQIYPMHVYSALQNGEFNIKLNTYKRDVENECNRSILKGYSIYLHTPGDVVKPGDRSIQMSMTEEVRISITPKMTTTANGLRRYKPSQRKCFFNSDRQLRFFKFYTEENCKAECLTNYTFQECGCVKFSMPRNRTTRICGLKKINCYKSAIRGLFKEDVISGLSDEKAKRFRKNCNCMPACTSITYNLDIDRTTYFEYFKPESKEYHEASVRISFTSHEVSAYQREEQYSNIDFLAICGGILGLCLGVSVLSIVEFVYFASLRLFLSLREFQSENMVVPLKPPKIH